MNEIRRLSIYAGVNIGDWVYCPNSKARCTPIHSACKKCDCYKGVERQDPTNPFNYNVEVLCAFQEENSK